MTRLTATDLRGVIRSAVSGDEIAFGHIVASYNDDMRRVCIVITRDQATAEDAVQTAWAIAWKKLGSLKDPDKLKPWLISIAANEARALIRKRNRRSDVERGAQAPSVAAGIDPATGIDSLDMLAAVERLKPEDRALLAMRYVAGFDATELSAATGITPAGTRTRLKRLIDQLRQELSDG